MSSRSLCMVERMSLREAFALWAILSLAGWRLILSLALLCV